MRGSWSTGRRDRVTRIIFACSLTLALLAASMASISVISDTADARGPAYNGEVTDGDGPAYFGPAPNPFPYCDSPTYFDPFPENVTPIGRMDIGDTASVTTDGVTMDLVITDEGNPDTVYPGFFPEGGDGGGNDRAKGIELAEGDAASVSLSAPLFYSQWIFTDVDQPNEGFTVTPKWTVEGQAAAFGGDNNFTFSGTTNVAVALDDTNGESERSESINGRVQVDFLGAVTGIDMVRTFPSNGQSGFAVGGGCEAAGAAKAVVAGPTWNGTSFDVTYELRMRNNLPSPETIQSVIDDAVAAVGASTVTGAPEGIILDDLQLTDDLRDDAFSNIVVTGLTTDGDLVLNDSFNGTSRRNLIESGSIDAESDETITLSVQYTPDLATANWSDCAAGYTYFNQTEVSGTAATVEVRDMSDNGTSAAPSDNNGEGGVDDPTPVNFPCPPGDLEIVKTVINGPNGTCPTFAGGVPGEGDTLDVTVDDVVTYCISVRNPGPGPVFDVTVTDPQGLGQVSLNDLNPGDTDTVSFDVPVALTTPDVNTAEASATDSGGQVGPVRDTAKIKVSPKDQPLLEIVKTVVAGPNGTCPAFEDGIVGLGPALSVLDGDTVTYCVSVRNVGPGDALNVVISDDQAPQDFVLGTLGTGEGATESYDLPVNLSTEDTNVATASYSGPDGEREPVSDNAQIDVAPLQPNLQIVKTVINGPGGTCPAFDQGVQGLGPALAVNDRDVVTYCVSVRNNGRGTADDVVISDTQADEDFVIGTLVAGAGETISYDIRARLTTEPINTATVRGNGPGGAELEPASDRAQIAVDALPDPILEIVKTALAGPTASCPAFDDGTPGEGAAVQFVETDVVTYCITVRNTGAGPATDVVIADDQALNTFDLNIGDLAPGQSETRSYDLPVDLDTEPLNIAEVSGQGVNGPITPVSDPARINVSRQADPVLEIVKTVVAGPGGDCPANFDAGTRGDGDPLPVLHDETVTFCITVRNVGGNPATSVIVTDEQAPATLQLGEIPVGEERSESYDVPVTDQTDDRNVATVNGMGPNGAVTPASDAAVIAPSPQPNPVLEIVKTVVAGPGGTCPAFAQGVAGPGDALDVKVGDVVTYCIAIRNIGQGIATNVTITDDQSPATPYDIRTLAAGEERAVQYDLPISLDTPLVNTAVVRGEGPAGPQQVEDDAIIKRDTRGTGIALIHSVSKADEACITAAKTLNSLVANREDLPIIWCAKVTNTGNVALTNVELLAPRISADPIDVLANSDANVLLPRASEVVAITGTIPETGLISNAAVTGDPSDVNGVLLTDLDPPRDDDSAEVREASIEIQTTVVAGADGDCTQATEMVEVPIGADITWCFAVTNTGAIDLEVRQVTDPALGIVEPIPGSPLRLGRDITVRLQTNDVAEGPTVIDADVKGKPLDFDGSILDQAPEVEDIDPAQIVIPAADLAIEKSNSDSGPVAIGTTLTYTLVISNNGPNAAQGVRVTDQLPTGLDYVSLPGDTDWTCALDEGERGFSCLKGTSLANAASATLTYTAVTTGGAVAGSDLVNTAVVTADTPDPDDSDNTDTSSTRTPPADETIPRTELPEYPGPFTPPAPPLTLEEPDEVLGLAITGAASNLLAMLSAAMLALGGVLTVGARRSREDDL